MSQFASTLQSAPLTRRSLLALLGVGAAGLGLAGCSNSSNSPSAAGAAASGSASASGTAITLGTEGTYAPYSYLDDSNRLTGFDIEVARAIDNKLPDWTFDFQTIEWSSMFASLDAGKIQTIANQVAKNDEREAKYLFGDTPYAYSTNAIVYKKGRTDIKTIEDLHGKKVDAGTTSANTTWLENYNEEHGNPIQIVYTDGDVSKMLQDVVNDRVDATINSPVTVSYIAKEQGIDVDWTVWTGTGVTPVYFPFPNTDEGRTLRDAFEGAIKELLADGTIAQLSEKFLGADYSTEDAVEKLANE